MHYLLFALHWPPSEIERFFTDWDDDQRAVVYGSYMYAIHAKIKKKWDWGDM